VIAATITKTTTGSSDGPGRGIAVRSSATSGKHVQ
jgi:hypothetical protein